MRKTKTANRRCLKRCVRQPDWLPEITLDDLELRPGTLRNVSFEDMLDMLDKFDPVTENFMSKTTIDKTPEQSALASAQCSVIPREHLVEMLKCAVWYSGGRECYGEHQGYSFDVDEETSLRDVLYRDEPLYKTPEEAIVAHWQRHYCRT